jgi:glycosyltransferase involved in cell wall biosynthesis
MKAASLRAAGFTGRVTVIEPYVRRGWFFPRLPDAERDGPVLSVINGIDRPLFDAGWWEETVTDLRGRVRPALLVGTANERWPHAVGPAADWDALRRLYAQASAYVNPCAAPLEDAFNLAALEAYAAGVPVVSRQQDAWEALTEGSPFDPFDRLRFRNAWLVALAEATDG